MKSGGIGLSARNVGIVILRFSFETTEFGGTTRYNRYDFIIVTD